MSAEELARALSSRPFDETLVSHARISRTKPAVAGARAGRVPSWLRRLAAVVSSAAPPSLGAEHFGCPNCGVDATQIFEHGGFPYNNSGNQRDDDLQRSTCRHCGGHAYWVGPQLVWPEAIFGDEPSADLPDELLPLYEEARAVAPRSPRAAAALLRLLIDQLVSSLGGEGRDLKDRIGTLHESNQLARSTIDALDAVRVGGNNALHEGQIDPHGDDDAKVVELLFSVVNRIVGEAIAMPRQIADVLGSKRRPDEDPQG